jgi:uncharacterized membrane protein
LATLTVWKFDSADEAEQVRERVLALQEQDLISIHDAVVVDWPVGERHPSTHQATHLSGAGAAVGGFWGLLFGLLFFVPIFGLAIGAAAGALTGSLGHLGIDDTFVEALREKVTPGTSALFLLSSDAVLEPIRQQLGDVRGELIATNLSIEDENALRDLFAD